jgi:hypothetical protein
MDKFLLQQQVLERLAEDLLQAEQAVRAAHETATHEENIAENKYDTLGLEAAYLATGQARRAEAIRQAMANWRQFRPRPYDASKGIQLGALVCLVDSDDKQQQLFLGPDGGSMKLVSGAQLVQVISSRPPWAGPCWANARVMRCRYRSLQPDSGLRCCGFIELQASPRRIDQDLLTPMTGYGRKQPRARHQIAPWPGSIGINWPYCESNSRRAALEFA